jgi:hypothetical protein
MAGKDGEDLWNMGDDARRRNQSIKPKSAHWNDIDLPTESEFYAL